MVPAATTVGGYLQSLPNDRRVAMARVCSMIRRSARGVRESMRFGLAFYELDGGPVFAVESRDKALVFFTNQYAFYLPSSFYTHLRKAGIDNSIYSLS